LLIKKFFKCTLAVEDCNIVIYGTHEDEINKCAQFLKLNLITVEMFCAAVTTTSVAEKFKDSCVCFAFSAEGYF
jgi:uridine phosphorylase